jgi:plastocyanin
MAAFVTVAMFTADAARAATTTVQAGQQNGGLAAADEFNSAVISVAPGDTVHWAWFANAFGHTIVSFNQTGGIPDWQTPAALTGAGQSFDHTFASAGTFTYYCSIHAVRADADPANLAASLAAGKMVGRVRVATPSVGGVGEVPPIASLRASDGADTNWGPWSAAVAGLIGMLVGGSAIAWWIRRSRRRASF